MLFLLTFDTEEEKEKFSILYQDYAEFMQRVARRFLLNSYDAEDAVQDAFLYVAGRLDKIDLSDKVRTKSYLALITKHKAIDLLRRTENEVVTANLNSPVLANTEWSRDEDLSKAILDLSPESREILLLHYIHNYSYYEIAVFLGQSYRSITGKAERARRKLAGIIKEGGNHG